MLQGSQSTGKYITPKPSYILKSTSFLGLPHSCSRLLVIIAGWHNQPHFTLLPPMQHHRPTPHLLPTTILLGTGLGLVVQKIKDQRKERPRGLGKETSPVGRLENNVRLLLPHQRDQGEDRL